MRIVYGDEIIHEDGTENIALDVEFEESLRACGVISFKLPKTHQLCRRINLDDSSIVVYSDDEVLMKGNIFSARDADFGSVVFCAYSELAYLNDVLVRPFENKFNAAQLFDYLISSYTKLSANVHRFAVGINQGLSLGSAKGLGESYVSYGKFIKDVLLDNLGGFIRTRYSNNTCYLDLLANTEGVASQQIDFGENLLSFSSEIDTSQIASTCVALGKDDLTLSALPDFDDATWQLVGDRLTYLPTSRKVGYKEYVARFELDDRTQLLEAAKAYLLKNALPIQSINVSAYDLSQINVDYDPIKLGDYVRVISGAHNYDSYMIVSKIIHRPTHPQGSLFTLGLEGEAMTSAVQKRVQALNKTASDIVQIAQSAKEQAQDAKDKSIASVQAKYALNRSFSTPPDTPISSWLNSPPKRELDTYIWHASITTYGDNTKSTSAPVCITGDKGSQGDKGAQGDKGSDGQMGPPGQNVTPTYYIYCATPSADPSKVGTMWSNSPIPFPTTLSAKDNGICVNVRFAYRNTASNPTLKIGNSQRFPIYTSGVNSAYWDKGYVTVLFTYLDSSHSSVPGWHCCSNPVYASTVTVGNPAGGNVYIDNDSVDIRTGSLVGAKFYSSGLDLAQGKFKLWASGDNFMLTSTKASSSVFLGNLNAPSSGIGYKYWKEGSRVDDCILLRANKINSGGTDKSLQNLDRTMICVKPTMLYGSMASQNRIYYFINSGVITVVADFGSLKSNTTYTSTSYLPYAYRPPADMSGVTFDFSSLGGNNGFIKIYSNGKVIVKSPGGAAQGSVSFGVVGI